MINNILIIDLETTGIDPKDHVVTEIGISIYSVPHRCVISQFSFLVPLDGYRPPEEDKEAQALTGIPLDAVGAVSNQYLDMAYRMLNTAYRQCDAIGSYSDFDERWCKAKNLLPPGYERLPWIDFLHDFEWPNATKERHTLLELAYLHKSLSVLTLHRALSDCMLLTETLNTVEDLEERLEKALDKSAYRHLPHYLWCAVENYPGAVAKENKFIWTSIIPKQWCKWMPICDVVGFPLPLKLAGKMRDSEAYFVFGGALSVGSSEDRTKEFIWGVSNKLNGVVLTRD